MIWSKSCLVRPSDGVVEGPLRGAIELGARGRRSEVLMLWLPLVSSHEAETEADRQPFTPTIMVSIFYQNHQSNNRRHNIYVCRTVVQIKYSIEIPSRQNCKRQLSTRNDRVIHRQKSTHVDNETRKCKYYRYRISLNYQSLHMYGRRVRHRIKQVNSIMPLQSVGRGWILLFRCVSNRSPKSDQGFKTCRPDT